MVIYDTIKKYSETFNNRTLHPLINLIDLNQSAPLQRTKFRLDFYAIIVKESDCGELRYGNQYYDYSEGTVVFVGPGQVMTSLPEGEIYQPTGKALIFHPDLLRGNKPRKANARVFVFQLSIQRGPASFRQRTGHRRGLFRQHGH